jgi:hypothetical protein
VFVTELIDQIPSNTAETVKAAKKRFDKLIREALRSETRLKLIPSSPDKIKDRAKGFTPIYVDEVGYPEDLNIQRISPDDRLFALLSLWRPTIVQLHKSSGKLKSVLHGTEEQKSNISIRTLIENQPNLSKLIPSVSDTFELADILLKQIVKFDLVKHILSINKDILGVYKYHATRGYRSSGHMTEEINYQCKSKIVLYWGVIGLCANQLEVSIEAMTAVVLAHELAHAYTHLGYDIDNYRWGALNFHESDHEIKEGLAQYYTDRVIANIGDKIPGAKSAYNTLLERQPDAYREHLPWIDRSTPEAVRNTIILLRKSGPIKINQFGEQLFMVTPEYKSM